MFWVFFFSPSLVFVCHSGCLHTTGIQPADRNTQFPLLPLSPKEAPSGKNELMLNIWEHLEVRCQAVTNCRSVKVLIWAPDQTPLFIMQQQWGGRCSTHMNDLEMPPGTACMKSASLCGIIKKKKNEEQWSSSHRQKLEQQKSALDHYNLQGILRVRWGNI